MKTKYNMLKEKSTKRILFYFYDSQVLSYSKKKYTSICCLDSKIIQTVKNANNLNLEYLNFDFTSSHLLIATSVVAIINRLNFSIIMFALAVDLVRGPLRRRLSCFATTLSLISFQQLPHHNNLNLLLTKTFLLLIRMRKSD